jgi:hypothetical protein
MEKTAVEWLMEQITFLGEFGGRYNSFIETEDLSTYFEKAKEMEKQQLIDAVEWGNRKGYDEHVLTCINDEDEKYYNNIFYKG